MSEQLAYFTVVRVWFSVGAQMRDPHVPDHKQYHHGVYVRTRKNGSGILHHAVGDVTSQSGMRYEAKERDDVLDRKLSTPSKPWAIYPCGAVRLHLSKKPSTREE